MTQQNAPAASVLQRVASSAVCALLLGSLMASAHARAQNAPLQTPPGTTSAPVVDSAPASPTTPPPAVPATDAATQSSPNMPVTQAAPGTPIPGNTMVAIHLGQSADSAHVKNGDMLKATLASPVRLGHGGTLRTGTSVGLTVVSVAAAGQLQSRGEMTLQVVRVGTLTVFSNAITFHGKAGHKDLPDSAPAKGTEASLTAGQTLHFVIPPMPQ